MRIGIGFDAHRLVEGRDLFIGGVKLPYNLGLHGHSDADVLCHAIGDALLGAANEGDLGKHFPSDDPRYKAISSLKILKKIREIVRNRGLRIAYIDSTIVAEQPQFAPYIKEMKEKLSQTLDTHPDKISIKATTTDGLGFTGKKEGIAAIAVVLLY